MNKTKCIYYLYQYTNQWNEKRYIGVTNQLRARIRSHAQGRSGAPAFNRAMLKYGYEAFDFQILAEFDDPSTADYHEQAAILAFRTLAPNGYNLTAGAPYTRYGGPLSEITRNKIRAVKVGQVISEEQRKKISETLTGRRLSASHKEAIGIALVGNRRAVGKSHPQSEATKEAIRKAHTGKKLSEEHKKAIGNRQRGIKRGPRSAEVRAKISAGHKRRAYGSS
jgi:group I intron endonuclease